MKFPGFLLTSLLLGASAFSEDWYLSNPSGLALERSPSKMTALRAEWSVSVDRAEESALPGILRPYYETGFSIELRVLYNRGKPIRRQWIFRSGSLTRLNASLPAEEHPKDPSGKAEHGESGTDDETADHERLPFIELYSPEYLLTELLQIHPSGERYSTRYRYSDGLLVGSETTLDGELLWTDGYRYTRTYKLRGMERKYAGKKVPEKNLSAFPGESLSDENPSEENSSGKELSEERAAEKSTAEATRLLRFPPRGSAFISPDSPYDYRLRTGALRDVFRMEGVTVRYSTDEQGRVIYEEHLDGDGKQIASLSNEWSGERLLSVTWNAGDAAGKVELDYTQSGEAGGERNYRNGVLERKVTRDGSREIEELYRDGRPILRAVWENGRKITEERL
jgi:hypothetical protein